MSIAVSKKDPGLFALRSLRAKFLVVVVPLVLLSTLTVFGLFELNAQREAEQRLRDKLEKLVAIQSAVVAESLWNVADEQIKLILEALATDPDVSGAAVYDDLDILVGWTGKIDGFEQQDLFAEKEIVYIYDDTPEVIGRLAISLTDAQARADAQSRLILAVGLATFLLAAVVLSALVANRRTIGIPLERLLGSINRARQAGEREPVDWNSQDEIGVVVAAFKAWSSPRSTRCKLASRPTKRSCTARVTNWSSGSKSGPRNWPWRANRPSGQRRSFPKPSRASPRVSRSTTPTTDW